MDKGKLYYYFSFKEKSVSWNTPYSMLVVFFCITPQKKFKNLCQQNNSDIIEA